MVPFLRIWVLRIIAFYQLSAAGYWLWILVSNWGHTYATSDAMPIFTYFSASAAVVSVIGLAAGAALWDGARIGVAVSLLYEGLEIPQYAYGPHAALDFRVNYVALGLCLVLLLMYRFQPQPQQTV